MNKGSFTSNRLLNNKYAVTHGLCKTKSYSSWSHAKNRCLNANHHAYYDYGGRGITICDEWLTFEGFYKDMGECPEGMSLDRIDVNGNYEKKNCRWSTRSEQQRNRRDSTLFFFNGKNASIHELSNDFGISAQLIRYRVFKMKMNIYDALNTPIRKRNKTKRAA